MWCAYFNIGYILKRFSSFSTVFKFLHICHVVHLYLDAQLTEAHRWNQINRAQINFSSFVGRPAFQRCAITGIAERSCHDANWLQKVNMLVESMIWRDRNLKFGPNYDLEVDNFSLQIIHIQIIIWGPNFKFRSRQIILSVS